MKTAIQAMRRFCAGLPFALILFAVSALILLLKAEVWGTLAFVMLLSVLLVLCDDITVTTLPFLLVCTFVLTCYDSFNTFIVFAPLGVIPVAAFLFHFIAYRQKFRIGPSFFGIAAVAVAVTAGGAFSITAEEYFSGTSLFYIAGLGIGMVAAYILMKSQFLPREGYNLRERLFAIFYIAGFFGVFMIGSYYVMNLSEILSGTSQNIQWSNNLSTLMMFYLPIPFYYTLTKHRLHIAVGLLFYLAIFLTGSRGGILMGGLELVLCLVFVSFYDKPLRITAIAIGVCALIFAVIKMPSLSAFLSNIENEPRFHLMKRALTDFLDNPVFGQGIGYTGNFEHYNPVKGAANWYHMMPFQIIGSFGTIGILAFGYQMFGRGKLIFHSLSKSSLTLGLSYAGILLMSMVNPGEFCPIPYELLTVLLFIFLEMPEEQEEQNAFLPFTKKKLILE